MRVASGSLERAAGSSTLGMLVLRDRNGTNEYVRTYVRTHGLLVSLCVLPGLSLMKLCVCRQSISL